MSEWEWNDCPWLDAVVNERLASGGVLAYVGSAREGCSIVGTLLALHRPSSLQSALYTVTREVGVPIYSLGHREAADP
jgi:hypothetical protein